MRVRERSLNHWNLVFWGGNYTIDIGSWESRISSASYRLLGLRPDEICLSPVAPKPTTQS